MRPYRTTAMNTVRPEHIPEPPDGWIYVEGPIDVAANRTSDTLQIFEDGAWVRRNLNGKSSRPYCVKEGSEAAINNGLGVIKIEPKTIKQIYEEAEKNGAAIIILTEPYWVRNGVIFAKGMIKKAWKLTMHTKLGTTHMKSAKKLEFGFSSRMIAYSLTHDPAISIQENMKRMEKETLHHVKRIGIIPRHMGITQKEANNHSKPNMVFRVL